MEETRLHRINWAAIEATRYLNMLRLDGGAGVHVKDGEGCESWCRTPGWTGDYVVMHAHSEWLSQDADTVSLAIAAELQQQLGLSQDETDRLREQYYEVVDRRIAQQAKTR